MHYSQHTRSKLRGFAARLFDWTYGALGNEKVIELAKMAQYHPLKEVSATVIYSTMESRFRARLAQSDSEFQEFRTKLLEVVLECYKKDYAAHDDLVYLKKTLDWYDWSIVIDTTPVEHIYIRTHRIELPDQHVPLFLEHMRTPHTDRRPN